MRRLPSVRGLVPPLLALLAAEVGVRALSPREPTIEPARVDSEDYFSPEELERGRSYARAQLLLGLAGAAVEQAALVAIVREQRGRRPRRRRWRRWRRGQAERSPALGSALAGASMAVGLTVLPLPLSALARRRSVAVGLSTQSWGGWAADLVKSTAIESVFAAGAGAAVTATIRRYPRGWWVPVAAGSVGAAALFGAAAPVLLAPLFNDFTPLPEGQTRSDVLELAREAGVDVGEVYSVDASRRTTGANAYVTGLGPTKRVVLFDTLLDRYDRDQVRVVVAHELAHVRNRDVPRLLAYAAIVAPAGALAVQRLSWWLAGEQGTPGALPALALAAALVAVPTGLVANQLSRAVERRADAYSLELSNAPDAFISFMRAIALQNVADVRPPRWLAALLASHPPPMERIGAAVAFAQRSSPGA